MPTSRKTPSEDLSRSPSLYLRSAADQPVRWQPWGEGPFRQAKETGRPILLDIGASWCHWCHVMDEGTYADPEVAELVNQLFIPVKVDRDENPELDRRYQREVSALTGQGGWPLTAFLTPQGEVFLGGTYFPPQDHGGQPGFRRVLREVARMWREERESLRGQARAIQEGLRSYESRSGGEAPAGRFVAELTQRMLEQQDPVHGGFGGAPKFPHPTAIRLLLFQAHSTGEIAAAQAARRTLRRMADGGVYDQLGGGFHRYSVDEAWHIPHFEKMAVDNGHLLEAYREGFEAFGEPRFREVLEGTARWTLAVLGGGGMAGFGASQDADNAPGDDGGFYTFSRAELKRALSAEELKAVTWYYGLGSEGQMPHHPEQNVLYRFLPLEELSSTLALDPPRTLELLRGAEEKMRKVRSARRAPAVDPARYASLNGVLSGPLAQLGRLLGKGQLVEAAEGAMGLFLERGYSPERGVAHQVAPEGASGYGLLEDQVFFALGLLDLAEVTQKERYLLTARRLLELCEEAYRLPSSALLGDVAPSLYDGPKVGSWDAPSATVEDTPHLSANSASVLAWQRLESLSSDPTVGERYRPRLRALTDRLRHSGLFGAGAALAAGWSETEPLRITVEGEPSRALLEAALSVYHPRKVVLRGPLRPPFGLPLEAEVPSGRTSTPRALLCTGRTCLAPLEDAGEVRRNVAGLGRFPESERAKLYS